MLDLITHERQARDRCWWHALEQCYTPDTRIQADWFDGTADDYIEQSKQIAEQLGGQAPGSHRVGQPVIDVNGDRAVVRGMPSRARPT